MVVIEIRMVHNGVKDEKEMVWKQPRDQMDSLQLFITLLLTFCLYCESHLQGLELIPCAARNPQVKE